MSPDLRFIPSWLYSTVIILFLYHTPAYRSILRNNKRQTLPFWDTVWRVDYALATQRRSSQFFDPTTPSAFQSLAPALIRAFRDLLPFLFLRKRARTQSHIISVKARDLRNEQIWSCSNNYYIRLSFMYCFQSCLTVELKNDDNNTSKHEKGKAHQCGI